MSLENPFWSALHGPQRAFALTAGAASRYQPEFASQGALREDNPQAWRELRTLTQPGETLDLIHAAPLNIGSGWTKKFDVALLQMQLPGPSSPPPTVHAPLSVRPLTTADVPAMLDLVALTKPGPFRARTIELGLYLGAWDGPTLAAMAGQRAQLHDRSEISAVCTHPQHRRRGLALALVHALTEHARGQGQQSFLHVNAQNESAIQAYRRLGFQVTRPMTVTVVRREP